MKIELDGKIIECGVFILVLKPKVLNYMLFLFFFSFAFLENFMSTISLLHMGLFIRVYS